MKKQEEKEYFTVTDKEGKKTKYEILFTFTSEDTEKKYIVYTDNSVDKEGFIKTFASIYEEDASDEDKIKLTPIEDEKEWALVEKLLNQTTEEI